MSLKSLNIMIVGVGGQGIILLSDIIAEVFFRAGYKVKKSDLRGIAQRGGSVISHLRIGKRIYSPLIPKGEVDILIALELLEAYRWIDYLKKGGLMIALDRQICSSGMTSGQYRYHYNGLISKIKAICRNLEVISWDEINNHLPDIRLANVFMLGVISNYFPFKIRDWQEAMKHKLPHKLTGSNFRFFSAGRNKFNV